MEQSRKRVLVADGDEIIIALVSCILERQSFAVSTALDAREVERLLNGEAFDAVVLDMSMPGGGVDLLRRIAKRDVGKVIAVTLSRTGLADAETLGVHAVMTKPVELGDLVDAVRSCVWDPKK